MFLVYLNSFKLFSISRQYTRDALQLCLEHSEDELREAAASLAGLMLMLQLQQGALAACMSSCIELHAVQTGTY
jgi:hypothetical protein